MGNVTPFEWPAMTSGRSFGRDARVVQDDLPPPRNNHWVLRQKLAVVDAVNSGRLPLREAMRRYEMSLEEFVSWQDAYIRDAASRSEPVPEHVALPGAGGAALRVAERLDEPRELLELAY